MSNLERLGDPVKLMEPCAFLRSNDHDWRVYQHANGTPDAVQRSIAISLKRIADALEASIKGCSE